MMSSKRVGRSVVAAGVLAVALAAPATATAPDANSEHKVIICHVTNSDTNPFVVITVDVAAYDGDGANDRTSHVAKDGRVDVLYENGQCGDDGGPTDGGQD